MDLNNIPPQLDATYEWEIENFSMCPQSIGECLKSEIFYLDSVDVSEYQLVLYPRGRMPNLYETPVCLLECHKESDFRIDVNMTVSFEGEEMRMKREAIPMKTRTPISFDMQRLKRPLEKDGFALLPGDVFTVRCTITLAYDPQTDLSDLVTLSEDLERLYLSRMFSDFCLVASEGCGFPVHKIMLAARCPELAKKLGIFDRKDSRSMQGRIQATAEALEVFLEYVYTGRLRGNVATDVLNEIHSLAVHYDIDDLKRAVFPIQVCTVGRTSIKVDRHEVEWTVRDFRSKVEEGDWPSTTCVDFVFGQILVSFYARGTAAQIEITRLKLKVGKPLTTKCVVRVVSPYDDTLRVLCEGGHQFHPEGPCDVFRLRGDLAFLFGYRPVREFPDDLVMVFDFRVSYSRVDSDRCNNVEGINALENPHPLWMPSLHRLSVDLDSGYKDTYRGNDDSQWWTHSDMRMGVGFGPFIPVHRCILSARSYSLMTLINQNDLSPVDNAVEIHIPFVDLLTVHYFMRYVYSGKLPVDVDVKELIPVYSTSVRYEVRSLAERCLQLIRRNLQLRHLKYLLPMSEDGPLRTIAVDFARTIKDRIQSTPEWAEIMMEIPNCASGFLIDVFSASDSTAGIP